MSVPVLQTPPQTPAPDSQTRKARARRVMGTRIAQKILLGYVLPLAVLLMAGIVLPFLLWAFLGRAMDDYSNRAQFAKQAVQLRKAAQDTLEPARVYLRYHDEKSQETFASARDEFRYATREVRGYAEEQNELRGEKALQEAVGDSTEAYNKWLRESVLPPLRQLERQQENREPEFSQAESERLARRVDEDFTPVRDRLNVLVREAANYRDRQERTAHALDLVRHITSIVIPIGAALAALLIARVLALGIVRPLQELRRATEDLESGSANRLLMGAGGLLSDDEPADDEIGDLQRAFKRMARTIRQREAVLRAQNEAVAALNRRVEAVLNSTNDGIMLLDRGGGFSLVNERFAHLFGVDMDELLDHTFAQAGTLLLSRFRNKAVVRRRLQEIIDDPEAVADDTFDIVEPLHRTLRIYSAPVRGEVHVGNEKNTGELLGRIFVFRDVTRETTVDRMKTEFVSTVSHELRTPLTAIKGYVDLMVGGQTGALNEIQSEFLTMVQSSTQRLTALINDMLDISRIESGRIEVKQEEIDYLPVVQQTVRMMGREADARQITVDVQVVGGTQNKNFARVSGDADRITQVLVNLLSNALKYTPNGGKVTVLIEWEENFVTTCVVDNGIGLSGDDQKRLFQKFFRADNSTTREVGGTGLGLAITKAILEKLNGSVWVESKPGVGSKFFFTLPTADPLPPRRTGVGTSSSTATTVSADTTPLPAPPPANQCLILSVDGDVSVLHRLGHEMRRRGFVTASAATVSEALRRARGLRPDVITLDPLTPGIDGFAVLNQLRSDPKTAPTPVALFSLRLVGGRTETETGHAFIARYDLNASTLAPLLESALQNRIGETAGETGPQPVFLVIAEGETRRVLQSLIRKSHPEVQLLTAASTEKADKILGSLWPDLVVVDIQSALGGEAGTWLARLKRRRPGAFLPVLVVTDVPVADGNVVHDITPFGSEPLPLHLISDVLTELLVRHRVETTPPSELPEAVCLDSGAK